MFIVTEYAALTLSYFTYFTSLFNNSVNQVKWELSLGIMEEKGLSFLMQSVHFW